MKATRRTVEKLCACGEHRWTKCSDPWYLKTIEHLGRHYSPNLTRYARVVLDRTITAKGEAEDVGELVRRAIRNNVYVSAKDYRPPAPAAPAPVGLTLATVAAKFDTACIEADAKKRPTSKVNDRAIIKRLCDHQGARGRLGDLEMAALTVDDLVAFRGAQAFANSTWNKYRTLLGQLWEWARWSDHLAGNIFGSLAPS
jgi:hypothetical protein